MSIAKLKCLSLIIVIRTKKEMQVCDQDAGLVGVSKCKQTERLAAVDSGFGCALVAFVFNIVVDTLRHSFSKCNK